MNGPVESWLSAEPRRARRWSVLLFAAALLAVFAVPFLRIGLVADAAVFSVAVLAVDLIVGYAGQISLGHGAFVGIGAYTTVILAADHGWPLLLTVPAGAAVAFVVGLAAGVPALRIRGLYLALVTLGIAVVFGPIVKRMDSITGGTNGKSSKHYLYAPSWFGEGRVADARWVALMLVLLAAAVFVIVRNIVHGRMGRSLAAIRENELSAATFGVPVGATKIGVFAISAGVAAVAGSMIGIRSGFVNEPTFSPQFSIQLYTAVFLGGAGTIGGAIVGGVVVVMVPFVMSQMGLAMDVNLLYGVALVVLTLFAPDGIMGGVSTLRRRLAGRRAG